MTQTEAREQARLAVQIAGARLDLLSCGAAWAADYRLLVVSDLHLEKGSAYARDGQMLPPYDTRQTLNRLEAAIDRLRPRQVVSLGDSLHDGGGADRMARADFARLQGLVDRCDDWVWIEGNHDPRPPAGLGGRTADTLRVGPLVFRHEPSPGPVRGEIAGHLHPCARVAGRGRSIRARCFACDGDRMVMPAYGAMAGGLNVLDAVFAAIFPVGMAVGVLGRDGVYAVGADRLREDRI